MEYSQPIVVAECCCNHQGNVEIATTMIQRAKEAGANYVKFQKRNPKESVPKEWHHRPHPVPSNAFGNTYLKHREFLEFDIDTHKRLQDYCREQDIGYASSVWDMTSALEIISLDPQFIKIPSACNNNYELITYLLDQYNGEIHISLGMSHPNERQKLLDLLKLYKNRIVIYWTTSGYPVPFDELYLLEILNIPQEFRKGYSGHNLGIAIDIAAYTLGSAWIERHFTLDRTLPGTDHPASLEPQGIQKLCRDLKATYEALSYKNIDMTNDEIENRKKLRGN